MRIVVIILVSTINSYVSCMTYNVFIILTTWLFFYYWNFSYCTIKNIYYFTISFNKSSMNTHSLTLMSIHNTWRYTSYMIVVWSNYFTVNPSDLRHTLWASIRSWQNSSPLDTMHSSLGFLVSGQLQQIFLPDFPNIAAGALTSWMNYENDRSNTFSHWFVSYNIMKSLLYQPIYCCIISASTINPSISPFIYPSK